MMSIALNLMKAVERDHLPLRSLVGDIVYSLSLLQPGKINPAVLEALEAESPQAIGDIKKALTALSRARRLVTCEQLAASCTAPALCPAELQLADLIFAYPDDRVTPLPGTPPWLAFLSIGPMATTRHDVQCDRFTTADFPDRDSFERRVLRPLLADVDTVVLIDKMIATGRHEQNTLSYGHTLQWLTGAQHRYAPKAVTRTIITFGRKKEVIDELKRLFEPRGFTVLNKNRHAHPTNTALSMHGISLQAGL